MSERKITKQEAIEYLEGFTNCMLHPYELKQLHDPALFYLIIELIKEPKT